MRSIPASRSDFAGTLETLYPDWHLIEIFGPPGAGKTYLCEQLAAAPGVLTTANHRGLHFYAGRNQWGVTKELLPYLGERIRKNYYGLRSRALEKEIFRVAGPSERKFLSVVDNLVQAARMSSANTNKITRSILRSTALALLCQREGVRVAMDEGLLRRLVDIYWRVQGASVAVQSLDSMRACLELFPFERNALAITAPLELCVARQGKRGHIIASPRKPQILFHDATEAVIRMCERAGWTTFTYDNR